MVDTRERAARGDGDRQGCWYLHTLTDGVRASGLMAYWGTRLISGGVPLPRREQKSESGLRAGSRYHHVSFCFSMLVRFHRPPAAASARRAFAGRRVRRPEGARDACAVGAVAR